MFSHSIIIFPSNLFTWILLSCLDPPQQFFETALFSDVEKEGPKWLWQPRPRCRRLGWPQPRVWGEVQENKRRHWSDDQQTETVCKYFSMNPEPLSHLSFLSLFLSLLFLHPPHASCRFIPSSVSTTHHSVPSCLCFPTPFPVVVGPGRHWTRRRTRAARARSSSLLSSSHHALRRNTNRLTKSLITW